MPSHLVVINSVGRNLERSYVHSKVMCNFKLNSIRALSLLSEAW